MDSEKRRRYFSGLAGNERFQDDELAAWMVPDADDDWGRFALLFDGYGYLERTECERLRHVAAAIHLLEPYAGERADKQISDLTLPELRMLQFIEQRREYYGQGAALVDIEGRVQNFEGKTRNGRANELLQEIRRRI